MTESKTKLSFEQSLMSVQRVPGGGGKGYSRKFRRGVCREGSFKGKTKNDEK